MVTSLHDGMNLVAKEFVSVREDGDGVLILSRFTGAARELRDALLVNPYDVDEMAAAIRSAVEMPPGERRSRMARMRQIVREHNIYRWAGLLLGRARAPARPGGRCADPERPRPDAAPAAASRRSARPRDGDGVLVLSGSPAPPGSSDALSSTPTTSTRWPRPSGAPSRCRPASGGAAWRGCARWCASTTSIAGPVSCSGSSRACQARRIVPTRTADRRRPEARADSSAIWSWSCRGSPGSRDGRREAAVSPRAPSSGRARHRPSGNP